MKLFVWKDVLCDYSCGMIICIADDIESARKAFEDEAKKCFKMDTVPLHMQFETDSEPLIYDLNVPCNPICHYVSGGG